MNFVDSVPKEEVVRNWSVLDASVIHLGNTDLFRTVIPSKIFESMSMGVPLLHGVDGESADIVRSENIGNVFEPENFYELLEGIIKLNTDRALREMFRQNCLKPQ